MNRTLWVLQVLVALVFLFAGGMKLVMPPGKPMTQFGIAPGIGLANLLIVGGGGWLLWRFGRRGR